MVAAARTEIATMKAQMTDERRGVEKVNHYLRHFFGHPFLSLQALPSAASDGPQYRFEIHRNGARAYHLSEGERSLIAFCYFVARLADVETGGKRPIIWIDDPVSSLDDNHLFFVHSLLSSTVARQGTFGQLFISTHSLTFLKYLMRLSNRGNERAYFIVHREGATSTIRQMPKHLQKFATEFHYLFHQIYRCSNMDENSSEDVSVLYGFANNMRKFLELFLFFKYPDTEEEVFRKLCRFFGDDSIAALLSDRVDNEYSHLPALFERGALPMDVPAMKQMADFVLKKMQSTDPDQYESLLASIGASKKNT
jgi:wobble nucleotide-excising tRNase